MSARDEPATVPPPAGEDDAYSATTKVGAMSAELMEKLRAEGLLPEEAPPVAMGKVATAAGPPPVPRPGVPRPRGAGPPASAKVGPPPPSSGKPVPVLESSPSSAPSAMAPPASALADDDLVEVLESLAPRKQTVREGDAASPPAASSPRAEPVAMEAAPSPPPVEADLLPGPVSDGEIPAFRPPRSKGMVIAGIALALTLALIVALLTR